MRLRRRDLARLACRCGLVAGLGAIFLPGESTRAFAQETIENGAHLLLEIKVTAPRPRQQKPRATRAAGRLDRPGTRVVIHAPPTDGSPAVASGPSVPQTMASQITVSGSELNARPVTRPGEILEAAPGLIVTQHSGEGKANQYFLRGYNLDHGTDMAIWVDDVPANMRTHAHGQGYADLNWLMPETVKSLDVRKGPYFADDGDFASTGSLRIGLIDGVPKGIAEITAGSFGYRRIFAMDSAKIGLGTLLIAGEAGSYDGPWINPDDVRKVNGLVPGNSARWFVHHRDGLFEQVEFDGSGTAAGDCLRADRPLRLGRSERRRQHQPLRAFGARGRKRRCRFVESERLRRP